MKTVLLSLFFFLSFNFLYTQQARVEVSGLVVDKNSEQPIEFATIKVTPNDGIATVVGTTTGLDGRFSVVVKSTDFSVEVSFLGFMTQKMEAVEVANGQAEMGTIFLSDQSQTLDEITVRAEKSQTEFKLDKRVFNVGKDLSSTGATALEVLNNVPSVNVDIEGGISLRGSSGVQILINGKPSVIASEQGNALNTITAEMIDRVEVITNPSAKYDAEGTAGILNIVLKKEERKGLNGAVSVNVGAPHNHSVGLSINRRTEKFNLFSQLGAGYRELPTESENINRDFVNNTTITSLGDEFRNEQFYNLVLGADYYLNARNVITLSGNFAYEVEDQPSATNFMLTDDVTGNTISEWSRSEVTDATNPKWQYELQYKRDFKDDKDHNLLFSAIGRFFGKDQSSVFDDTTIAGDDRSNQQLTRTNFSEAENTFKLDYTKPLSEKITIETGAQYVIKDVTNDFAVDNNENGVFVNDASLTNIFEYQQDVLGVYGTGAYEYGKFGVKLGLRVENTDLRTYLVNTEVRNNQNFTNLFPSGHMSYKISDAVSVQAGYSRRIYRPRLWDLNPFFNIRNNFSVRTGNPDLLPEFSDAYELTSIFIIGNASLNLGVFHRFTDAVIERVSVFENNVNTTKPLNIGTRSSYGLEVNGKINLSKAITINGDFNYNYFNRIGELEGTSFDFNAGQHNTKINTKFKLKKGFEFEITGQYQSSVQTVQGERADQTFADFGLRKKLFGGRGAISFSVRDVFASRIRESIAEQEDFFIYNRRFRGRFVTLGFSYGFGKGDTMEYSGQRRRY